MIYAQQAERKKQPFFFTPTAGEKISWKKVKMLCLWSWLYALIWALFPIVGWGRYGPEPFGLSCSLAWGQMKHEAFSFVIAIFFFNLVVPAVIILCCYFGIAIKLYFTYKKSMHNGHRIPNIVKLHRRLLVVSDALVKIIKICYCGFGLSLEAALRLFIHGCIHTDIFHRFRVGFFAEYPPVLFQIAVLISVGFIGCWTPYSLVSLWSIYRDSSTIPPEVSLLPCMFAKSSTVYNPVIYYFFSQSFKREVNQLSWLCLCCKPCPVSDTMNDTNIYMVSSNIKPKVQARCTLQEITDSKTMTLG